MDVVSMACMQVDMVSMACIGTTSCSFSAASGSMGAGGAVLGQLSQAA